MLTSPFFLAVPLSVRLNKDFGHEPDIPFNRNLGTDPPRSRPFCRVAGRLPTVLSFSTPAIPLLNQRGFAPAFSRCIASRAWLDYSGRVTQNR